MRPSLRVMPAAKKLMKRPARKREEVKSLGGAGVGEGRGSVEGVGRRCKLGYLCTELRWAALCCRAGQGRAGQGAGAPRRGAHVPTSHSGPMCSLQQLVVVGAEGAGLLGRVLGALVHVGEELGLEAGHGHHPASHACGRGDEGREGEALGGGRQEGCPGGAPQALPCPG